MRRIQRKQNFQDWVTQQWVVFSGTKIHPVNDDWLIGPFGSSNGIGLKFINQLAEREGLVIDHQKRGIGLLNSISQLNLSEDELRRLSKDVVDFYEKTADYKLSVKSKWHPVFKNFGFLLRVLFSNRLEQLNVPAENILASKGLRSEIIRLLDPATNEVKRVVWLRTIEESSQVVYSGVYETCTIPSGQTCIKAVFPLPNGNATVILNVGVGENGELILRSSGKRMGDSGFYFLLGDLNGQLWTKFVKSFKDELVVASQNGKMSASQTLTLWGLRVLKFDYDIEKIVFE